MLHLTFAESALERVPKSLWRHPSVSKLARRMGKHPGEMLLDRTYHHGAMLGLDNAKKRGRPDILHISLLSVLGTPLNRIGLLTIYAHTVENNLIRFNPRVRLPKNYRRFVGLIEKLYEYGRIPVEGSTLLSLERSGLRDLIEDVEPSYVLAFSRRGNPHPLPRVVEDLKTEEDPMVVIGAFPHGSFSKWMVNEADRVVCIDREGLETSVVASRVVYEFERAFGVPEERI